MAKKKATPKQQVKKVDDSKAEARPIGEGVDPLAAGNTLVNPTNSTGETHYDVKEKSDDVMAQEAQNKIDGVDADARAEMHNAQTPAPTVPNADEADQEEAAADREEEDSSEDAQTPPADDADEGDEKPADEL